MNKLMYLLLAVMMMLPLTACEEKDPVEYDTKTPATYADVQGYWVNMKNTYRTNLELKGDAYAIEVLNPFNENNVLFEAGTFSMEGNKITLTPLEGESHYGTLEAYLEDNSRTKIFFSPIGVFNKQ